MPLSKAGFAQRLETYRPSKTALGWCCLLSIVATIAVGFIWGGWVTGGTAAAMANSAAQDASTKLAADICAAQFDRDPNAAVQLAAMTKLESWDRADFITKGGWANLPGIKVPVSGAADLCARQLIGPAL
jgi:hypothetical protein